MCSKDKKKQSEASPDICIASPKAYAESAFKILFLFKCCFFSNFFKILFLVHSFSAMEHTAYRHQGSQLA